MPFGRILDLPYLHRHHDQNLYHLGYFLQSGYVHVLASPAVAITTINVSVDCILSYIHPALKVYFIIRVSMYKHVNLTMYFSSI